MARLNRNRNKLINSRKNKLYFTLNFINFIMILGIYIILAKMNGWI